MGKNTKEEVDVVDTTPETQEVEVATEDLVSKDIEGVGNGTVGEVVDKKDLPTPVADEEDTEAISETECKALQEELRVLKFKIDKKI